MPHPLVTVVLFVSLAGTAFAVENRGSAITVEGEGNDRGQPWRVPEEAAVRANPSAGEDASAQRGQKLYKRNCAKCHGRGGRGDGRKARKLSTPPTDLVLSASHDSDGELAWKIAHGRGDMPPWNDVMDEQEIWDLVNYIKTIGGALSAREETGDPTASRRPAID